MRLLFNVAAVALAACLALCVLTALAATGVFAWCAVTEDPLWWVVAGGFAVITLMGAAVLVAGSIATWS